MGKLVIHAAVAAVTLACAAPVVAQTAPMTPALKELAAAANKEGELVVTWSSSTLGGPQGAKAFEDAINKAYGTKIRIKWAPGQSMPNVGNQIAMAYANKLPSPSDVYLGFSRNMAVLLKQDIFLQVPWQDYLPDRLTDKIVERGTFVKNTSSTTGFSYNKKLAPSVPERLEDFLKPEWKGKIATTAFGAGFDQLAGAWGPDKAMDYAKKFSGQVGGFMRCNEVERMTTGEFLALIFDCSGASTIEAIEKGAPLARTLSADIPLISYFYFAVPKNAAHPNVAKLFVTFSASKEGQKLVWDLTSSDLHLYPESKMGQEVAAAEKKYGIKFRDADIQWQIDNAKANEAQAAIAKMLSRN